MEGTARCFALLMKGMEVHRYVKGQGCTGEYDHDDGLVEAGRAIMHADHILCNVESLRYFLKEGVPRAPHHSYSMDSHMSLNQGVNLRAGSLNIFFNPSCETYAVSRTSFGLGSKSTSA